MKTTSKEDSRLNQIREKIHGWKKEGYTVDELEKIVESIKMTKMRQAKIASFFAIFIAIILISVVYYYSSENRDQLSETPLESEKLIEIGDPADVHYIGRYASNNTVFESSYDSVENKTGGTPLKIFVSFNKSIPPPEGYETYSSSFIDGLLEGLVGLCEGDKSNIIIPPEEGYESPHKRVGQTLIFEISVEKIYKIS